MIIAAIPARSGSKGIPNKNIVDLGGKPLLVWSIEVAKEVPEVDHIAVASDHESYGQLAVDCGVGFVHRDSKNCQDNSTDLDWVQEFISVLTVVELKPDLLIHLRPTTPLRDPKLISEAIKRLQDTPEATSLRSVHEMSETAWKCAAITSWNYLVSPFDIKDWHSPRQNYPKTYHPNGYVDILRVSHILEHGELYGDKILAFETPRVTEIDTPEDLEFVRWQIKRKE